MMTHTSQYNTTIRLSIRISINETLNHLGSRFNGGEMLRMCGLPPRLALAIKCGKHACDTAYVPRAFTWFIKS